MIFSIMLYLDLFYPHLFNFSDRIIDCFFRMGMLVTHAAQNELVEKGLENRSLGELRLHWQDNDEAWPVVWWASICQCLGTSTTRYFPFFFIRQKELAVGVLSVVGPRLIWGCGHEYVNDAGIRR